MANKKLPIPTVKYVAVEATDDKVIAEVYALLFKRILEQNAFVNKGGTL